MQAIEDNVGELGAVQSRTAMVKPAAKQRARAKPRAKEVVLTDPPVRSKDPHRLGVLYVVTCPEKEQFHHYKVGFHSHGYKELMKRYGTALGVPIVRLYMSATWAEEQAVHKQLHEYRLPNHDDHASEHYCMPLRMLLKRILSILGEASPIPTLVTVGIEAVAETTVPSATLAQPATLTQPATETNDPGRFLTAAKARQWELIVQWLSDPTHTHNTDMWVQVATEVSEHVPVDCVGVLEMVIGYGEQHWMENGRRMSHVEMTNRLAARSIRGGCASSHWWLSRLRSQKNMDMLVDLGNLDGVKSLWKSPDDGRWCYMAVLGGHRHVAQWLVEQSHLGWGPGVLWTCTQSDVGVLCRMWEGGADPKGVAQLVALQGTPDLLRWLMKNLPGPVDRIQVYGHCLRNAIIGDTGRGGCVMLEAVMDGGGDRWGSALIAAAECGRVDLLPRFWDLAVDYQEAAVCRAVRERREEAVRWMLPRCSGKLTMSSILREDEGRWAWLQNWSRGVNA
jgi:hypothetical protein